MAYVKLPDGTTIEGTFSSDVNEALNAYLASMKNGSYKGEIKISPEVTKIVEKVPVEVEKIVEKAVQVPVLPERPLTPDELAYLTMLHKDEMAEAARISAENVRSGRIVLGITGGIIVGGIAITLLIDHLETKKANRLSNAINK